METLSSPRAANGRSRRRAWLRLAAFGALLALALVMLLPFFRPPKPHLELGRDLAHLKQIGIACKLYAMDHEGAFPPSIKALEPDYLSSVALRELGFRDPKTQRPIEWLYYPGFGAESPAETIILASPLPSTRRERAIVRADTSGEVLPEAKFQRQLEKQHAP